MFVKRFLLLFLFVAACVCQGRSQTTDLSGIYTGKLFQGDESYTFNVTLMLKQEGNSVSGTFTSESLGRSRFFVIYNIAGTTDGRNIMWKDVSIVDERSSTTWFWCKKVIEAKVMSTPEGTVLSCDWKNDGGRMFYKKLVVQNKGAACDPGNFKLYKEGESKPLVRDTTPIVTAAPPVMIKADTTVQTREIDVKQRIDIVSDSVTLYFYDNGVIDNDTISVYYDNALLVSQQRLSYNPIIVKVPVRKDGANELVMFANNEGEIPPNSALLVFTDNKNRREITMVSTLKRSGSIVFVRK